jgi:hypothetical protein
MSTSLYQHHLGDEYTKLSVEIQAFHALQGQYRLRGEVDVIGAETIWGRLLSLVMRFPTSSPRQPFEFYLRTEDGRERWQRRFPSRTMASTMSLSDPLLIESFGLMKCRFMLRVAEHALVMEPQGMRYLGLPIPAFLLPKITATERGENGRLHFDVAACWPGKYLTVAYRGWLDIASAEHL